MQYMLLLFIFTTGKFNYAEEFCKPIWTDALYIIFTLTFHPGPYDILIFMGVLEVLSEWKKKTHT